MNSAVRAAGNERDTTNTLAATWKSTLDVFSRADTKTSNFFFVGY